MRIGRRPIIEARIVEQTTQQGPRKMDSRMKTGHLQNCKSEYWRTPDGGVLGKALRSRIWNRLFLDGADWARGIILKRIIASRHTHRQRGYSNYNNHRTPDFAPLAYKMV